MFSAFGALAALVAAAAAAVGVATYSRRFSWAAFGVAVGIGLLLAVVCHFWQQTILFLAIASVVFLGLGVMLQKVAPGSAIRGASAAMVLLYVFSWAAVQLADVFFFDRESALQRSLSEWANQAPDVFSYSEHGSTVRLALGLAFIAAAAFSRGSAKVVVIFTGVLLVALAVLPVVVGDGLAEWNALFTTNPLLGISAFVVIASLLIRLFTPTPYNDRRPKGEQHRTRNTPDRPDREP